MAKIAPKLTRLGTVIRITSLVFQNGDENQTISVQAFLYQRESNAMLRRFAARWVNDQERHRGHQNGVVEDVTFTPHEMVCFVSPMRQAKRIAHALNLATRFSDEELERVSAALSATESKPQSGRTFDE